MGAINGLFLARDRVLLRCGVHRVRSGVLPCRYFSCRWEDSQEGYLYIFVYMKSFAELIENRRSIRQFSEEQLLPEDVQALMTAALRAPSGKNRQQTRYILV